MDLHSLIHHPGVLASGAVVISVFVVFNVLEFAVSAYRRNGRYTLREMIINLTIALFQQLSDVLNKLIFIIGFVYVADNFSVQQYFGWLDIPVGWPLIFTDAFPYVQVNLLQLGIWTGILLLADLCQYWLHRLSHEVNILWAGHIVHHSMEAYNYSVALRQSFIESLYTWIFYLPLAVLGVPWPLFIMAYSVSLIWQFLVHTRYIDRLGRLETIFSTPSHHRVHHGKNDRYIDKNYGAFLIVWDKLFGTFEPETEPVVYGIKSPVGSQSPLWVNIHHHVRILELFRSARSLADKWQVIIGKPAFIPANLSDIDIETTLPVPDLSTLKKGYILLNFIGIAAFSILQIMTFDTEQNGTVFLLSAVFIILSHLLNIALLEGRGWADTVEVVRLILLIGVGIVLDHFWDWHTGMILALTASILLGYSYWVALDHKRRTPRTLHAH